MPVLVYVLALAVFAQGTSEFVLAGLIPGISADLGISIPHAGLLTTGFAIGMVVGAPLMAAFGRRLPPRWTLSAFLVVFVLAHMAGASTSNFRLLLITRIVSAIANAGFVAVALSAVASVVPDERRARALSVILGGTTLALIAGVPAGAWLGDVWGWPTALWSIAGISTVALVAVICLCPTRLTVENASPPRNLARELRVLQSRHVGYTLLLAVLANGATFCALTYLAPLAVDHASIDESKIPAVLALFGVGAFGGVTVAGRLCGTHWHRIIAITATATLVGWVIWALLAASPIAVWVLCPVQGMLSFALGATLIGRVMATSSAAPTMSGSFATVALNLGAFVGPVLGGRALSWIGPAGALVASAVLALVANGLRLASSWLADRPAPE